MELHRLSIAEATRALERRQISAVELVSSLLVRIDRYNDEAKALIARPASEDVLADAANHDTSATSDPTRRPLAGIPIALKANFQCAGLPCSAGSRILAEWVPRDDAQAVAALRRAGAIVVGMANMNEFANGPTGRNPHYGDPPNPIHPGRLPGGSSSGSAVALAWDMCFGATGSDTGGSIRTPASFCGVVGLKPTRGLVSMTGVFPFSSTLDHAGPMARSVDDVRCLLLAMLSRKVTWRRSRPEKERDNLVGLTVATDEAYFGELMDPEVRRCFERSLQRLEALGASVHTIALSAVADSLATATAILFSEAAVVHEQWLQTRADEYGEDVRESLRSGFDYTATDYVKAQQRRQEIEAEIDQALSRADILASPTVAIEPPRRDATTLEIEGRSVDALTAYIRCTAPFNLSGHPAVSVPAGETTAGCPVGLQLVSEKLTEPFLLSVAAEFEASLASEPSGGNEPRRPWGLAAK